jgi:hypothetical protein
VTDALLAPTDQEEAFSRAYVDAVSAGAGYTVSAANFDRDGIDVTISAGGDFRPRLDVQLKATIRLGEPTAGVFRYPLKRRNYDLLRVPATTPRILVVLALPEDPSLWLSVSVEIPTQVGRRFRFEAGRGSEMKSDTVPI